MQDGKRDTDTKNRPLDSGRRRGWGDLREQHWSMYIAICEIDRQARLDAWDRVLTASALGQPREMDGEGGGNGFGMGGHMYICGAFMSLCAKTHHSIVK